MNTFKIHLNKKSITYILTKASDEFITKNKDKLNWDDISNYPNIPKSFVYKYHNLLNADLLIKNNNLPVGIYFEKVYPDNSSTIIDYLSNVKVTEDDVEKYDIFNLIKEYYLKQYKSFPGISFRDSRIKYLTSTFIGNNILHENSFSEEFVEKYIDYMIMNHILITVKVSENFVEKYVINNEENLKNLNYSARFYLVDNSNISDAFIIRNYDLLKFYDVEILKIRDASIELRTFLRLKGE